MFFFYIIEKDKLICFHPDYLAYENVSRIIEICFITESCVYVGGILLLFTIFIQSLFVFELFISHVTSTYFVLL